MSIIIILGFRIGATETRVVIGVEREIEGEAGVQIGAVVGMGIERDEGGGAGAGAGVGVRHRGGNEGGEKMIEEEGGEKMVRRRRRRLITRA